MQLAYIGTCFPQSTTIWNQLHPVEIKSVDVPAKKRVLHEDGEYHIHEVPDQISVTIDFGDKEVRSYFSIKNFRIDISDETEEKQIEIAEKLSGEGIKLDFTEIFKPGKSLEKAHITEDGFIRAFVIKI